MSNMNVWLHCISNGTSVEVFYLSNAIVSKVKIIRNGLGTMVLFFFPLSGFFSLNLFWSADITAELHKLYYCPTVSG